MKKGVLLLIALSYLSGMAMAGNFKNITPKEALSLIEANRGNKEFVILDVRTPEEVSQGYIDGAINIDFYSKTFRRDLNSLDKDKVYLIYCRSGRRSGRTLKIMEELGFKEVYNMVGGIKAWVKEGFPLTYPRRTD